MFSHFKFTSEHLFDWQLDQTALPPPWGQLGRWQRWWRVQVTAFKIDNVISSDTQEHDEQYLLGWLGADSALVCLVFAFLALKCINLVHIMPKHALKCINFDKH